MKTSRLARINSRALVKQVIRLVCAVAVALGATPGFVTAPQVAHASAGLFTVNSSTNWIGKNDVLSLAEAVQVVNGTLTGPFTDAEKTQLGGCTFASSSAGWYISSGCGPGYYNTITFSPAITQVTLYQQSIPDLATNHTVIQSSGDGVPIINATGSSHHVFTINANDVWISGLSITNGDETGNYADIYVAGGKDANIAGNYLGTVPGATNCTPAGVTRNSSYGIYVAPNSTGSSGANNAVAYIFYNTIGCHNTDGIRVSGADYVTIGMHQDGTTTGPNSIGVGAGGIDLGNGSDGVDLMASGSDGVRYNQIKNNTIKFNNRNGITLWGVGTNTSSSTYSNVITKNTIFDNRVDGILLTDGAFMNSIGLTSNDRNTISSNGYDGIEIDSSSGNDIQYNYIGTSTSGIAAYPNGARGVYVNNHSSGTAIIGNVISGNNVGLARGIEIYNSDGATITGNYVGTSPGGFYAIANGIGILIGGSANTTIGGLMASDRNIISGNTDYAIKLLGSGTHLTYVDSNLIGLKSTGDGGIPNGGGILVANGSYSNTIGSTSTPASQYISGNSGNGITMQDTYSNTVGWNNRIGLGTDDTTALGNSGYGIYLSNSHDNKLAPNWIDYSGKAGVAILGTASVRNAVFAIQFKGNAGMPIDLGNDGISPNGSHSAPGPNDWLRYPIVTSHSGGTLYGKACASCFVDIYSYDASTNTYQYAGYSVADASGNWWSSAGAGTTRVFQACQLGCSWQAESSEISPPVSLFLPAVTK